MLNLDTNILIHFVEGRLRSPELRLIDRERLGVSSIVFWEISKLKQLGRIGYDFDHPLLGELLGGLTVWEIDRRVAAASTALDFRSDPADELIAATSIVHSAPLLPGTRSCSDRNLYPWQSASQRASCGNLALTRIHETRHTL